MDTIRIKVTKVFERIRQKMDLIAQREADNDVKLIELSKQQHIFYHVRVSNERIQYGFDNTDAIYFEDAADLQHKLPSVLGFVIDQYDLQALLDGDIRHITIGLGPEDFSGDDMEVRYG